MAEIIDFQKYKKTKQDTTNPVKGKGVFNIVGLEREIARSLIRDIYEHLTTESEKNVPLSEELIPDILLIYSVEDSNILEDLENTLEQILAQIRERKQ